MSERGRHTLVAVLLCLLTLAAYSPSLHSGFVWDDNFQIVRNPMLRPSEPWFHLFSGDVWGYLRGGQAAMSNYYRPLQMAAYRATAELGGTQPAPFHILNLLFHYLACFAAYLVAWHWTRRIAVAAAAAVLFVLHPIHSEAVFWIASLTELGCALFFFLAFWLFLLARRQAAQEPDSGKRRRSKPVAKQARRTWLWAASCVCFLLALLWKEMALTLPLLVALYSLLFAEDSNWKTRLRAAATGSAPYWATLLVYVVVRVSVLGYFSKVQHRWPLTALQFCANAVMLTGEYLWRMIWPLPLNVFHVFHPARSVLDGRVIGAAAGTIAVLALAGYCVRRAPTVSFALSWMLVTLIPVLQLQAVGENVFAERYLYIPSLGLCVLVAWAWSRTLEGVASPKVIRVASVAALAVFSIASIVALRARARDWHDERSLFESAVRYSPDAAQMQNALGQVLVDAGDLRRAQSTYEAALRASESQENQIQAATAFVGLASIAWRQGDLNQALDLVHRGLARDSTVEALQVSEGILLFQLGRAAEAEQELLRANQYFPNDEIALNTLGAIALSKKDYAAAADYFTRAIHSVPTFADGYNNLGRVYLETGRQRESLPYFERAVELQPANPLFLTNYAAALARGGNMDQARLQLQRVLEMSPSYTPALQLQSEIQSISPQR